MQRRSAISDYFLWPGVVTGAGLILAAWLGWTIHGTLGGALTFLFVGGILAALEIALSFDNAIVNANTLKTMTPQWQKRFLTWGILIAVFGMRIVFPLAIVAVAASIGPIEALFLAVRQPEEYSKIIQEAHTSIAAFGGTFLMMVALSYFIDENKDLDWISWLEQQLRKCGSVRGLEIGFVLTLAVVVSLALPEHEKSRFMFAAIFGLLTFTFVDLLGHVLDRSRQAHSETVRGGLGAFLYLEVLDASFSFDGVIGAFALTSNLFLIAIGLGVGAMYVRSMTIMLVERQTLAQFCFLEHGAFYSIFALSIIMYIQAVVHVPELITGLIGIGVIGLALLSSIRHNSLKRRGKAV